MLIICKAERNSQYISNYCFWDKNKTFHNCFLKSVKEEIFVIDNGWCPIAKIGSGKHVDMNTARGEHFNLEC